MHCFSRCGSQLQTQSSFQRCFSRFCRSEVPGGFGLVSVRKWLFMLAGSNYTTHSAAIATSASTSHTIKDGDQELLFWQAKPGTLPLPLAAWAICTWINFKYPVVLPCHVPHKKPSGLNLLAKLWIHHAAALGVSNQKGWDLLIPVYVSDTNKSPGNEGHPDVSKLSYIAIQVKNCICSPTKYKKSTLWDLVLLTSKG